MSFGEYEAGLKAAGLTAISVTPTHPVADGLHGAIVKATKPAGWSAADIRAVDPAEAGRDGPAGPGRIRLLRRLRLLLTDMTLGRGPIAPGVARRDIVWLVLAAVCWGTGTVISKAALDEVPPLTLLPIQLGASLLILGVVMRRQRIPFRSGGSPLLGRLGLLNPGLAYALSLIGLTAITASVSVLLWAFEPLMIMALAAWFLHERITPAFIVLSLVAVSGLVLIVYDPAAGSSELIGIGLTVAGVACCAAYTVITRRWIPEAKETSQVVIAQQAHALALALVLVVMVGIAGGAIIPTSLTPLGLASAVGSGALYYAGAYWFYLGALRHVPASYASVSFYLIPIVGVTAGALLLGERLDARQWVGAVIVLGSVLAILRQPTACGPCLADAGRCRLTRLVPTRPLPAPIPPSHRRPRSAGTAARWDPWPGG